MSDEKTSENQEGHQYDGIIEHDHPLPRWWVYLFYATIVFAVGYYSYYELMGGPSSDQELQVGYEGLKDLQKNIKDDTAVDILKKINDPSFVQLGAKVFSEKCFMCHGDKGQGIIGPNLTDKFWIHGSKPENILYVIQNGVSDKGMPAWGAVLNSDEQVSLVAFILSLKNTNPPNPKPPQGEEAVD